MQAPPSRQVGNLSDDEAWPGWRLLSPLEVLMARNDTPNQPMVISAVFGFKSILPNCWVEDVFASRLAYHPRFRSTLRSTSSGQRFEYVPSCEEPGRVPPGVVHFELPADSTCSAADRSASFQLRLNELASVPMRADRALWTVHYFPGYSSYISGEAEESTIVLRVHHCVGDGIGLVKYCFAFIADKWAQAEAAKPPPPRRELEPGGFPSFWRLPFASLARGFRSAIEIYVGTLLPDAKSVYNEGALGREKFMEFAPSLSLDDVKAVARALGYTVNTVFSACVTTALREYLLCHGGREKLPQPSRFHAALAFNMHNVGSSDVSLSNKALVLPVELFVAEPNPDLRMKLTAEYMNDLKSGVKPALAASAMRTLMLVPAVLRRPLWRHMTRRASVVWTNVPGPREKSAIAGRFIDSIKVCAPSDGDCGLVFTMFSYAGCCSLCIGGDRARVSRPDVLIAMFLEEFRRLQAKVGRVV